MGETTPNLGLNKPFYREGRWDIPMNENSDILDLEVGQLQTDVAGKEPAISPGATDQYFRGDKTWAALATAVKSVVLVGLDIGLTGVISAADTVLTAFGRLQNQITAHSESDGTSHSYIDQDVTRNSSPLFSYTTVEYNTIVKGESFFKYDNPDTHSLFRISRDSYDDYTIFLSAGAEDTGLPSNLVISKNDRVSQLSSLDIKANYCSFSGAIIFAGQIINDIDTSTVTGETNHICSSAAIKASVLARDNTDVYTPTLDYHPATKKYVDDSAGGGGYWDRGTGTLTPSTATDRLLITDGTVTTPAYSFSSDPNTGIYRISSDQFGFSAAGLNKMTVSTTGVSIPTLSVPTSLDIARLRPTDGTVTAPAFSFSTDTNSGMYPIASDQFGFSAAGSNKMTVSTTGVSIPTLSVPTSLDIARLFPTGGTESAPAYSFDGDVDTGVHLLSANTLALVTAANAQVVIDPTGDVGIGTDTPDQALDVIGTIQASNLLGGATTLSCDASGNIIRTPSDEKLKTEIKSISGCLGSILRLDPISFYWKEKEVFGEEREVGFAAEKVAEVIPEAVRDGGEYLSLNTTPIVGHLVGAIKELAARLEEIENTVGLTPGHGGNKARPREIKKQS